MVASTGAAQAAGSWTTSSDPAQGAVYETAVRQPINADGSSSFKANGRGGIPVKFDLRAGLDAFRFESIFSDNDALTTTTADNENDFSFVSFRPPAPLPLTELTTLSGVYEYTEGNCGGGSLRWSVGLDTDGDGVRNGSVWVYYGTMPNFDDCSGPNSQSGVDLRDATDLRVDTSGVGGTFYDSWAGLAARHENATATSASLVVDGGWSGGDDRGGYVRPSGGDDRRYEDVRGRTWRGQRAGHDPAG